MTLLLGKAVPVTSSLQIENIRETKFSDIMRLPVEERTLWLKACKEEMASLRERDVYEIVDRPKNCRVVKNRWVFDLKTDGRKKARLVAKGFSQIPDLDYDQIFSPVVRYETVRIMLAVCSLDDWIIEALDVKTAFLYGKLDETIYMELPEGMSLDYGKPGAKVMLLKRALYGLKQAARQWWLELRRSMKKLGFGRCYSDCGMFVLRTKNGKVVIALIYVDDGLFVGNDPEFVKAKKAEFMAMWECRDLGACKEFLRMDITRSKGKITIDQSNYLMKVLKRFEMDSAKPVQTPLPEGYIPLPSTEPVNKPRQTLFQQIIGSLLYLALGTRPDIAYAVAKMSQMASNPTKDHVDKALRICAYLNGSRDLKITYDGSSRQGLIGFTDADWGGDAGNKHKSQTGFVFTLANGAVFWESRAQKTIAMSSTESEYMAASDCASQAAWADNLFIEAMLPDQKPIPINCDNEAAIFNAQNPVTNRKTKHIALQFHRIRDYIDEGKIHLYHIDGKENPADLLTKSLGPLLFHKFRPQFGLN